MSSRDASARSAASGDRYGIRVLDRAFSLLAIVSEGVPRTLVELSAEAGLNTTTTFRLGRATAAASRISTALGHRPDPRLARAGGQRRAVAAK